MAAGRLAPVAVRAPTLLLGRAALVVEAPLPPVQPAARVCGAAVVALPRAAAVHVPFVAPPIRIAVAAVVAAPVVLAVAAVIAAAVVVAVAPVAAPPIVVAAVVLRPPCNPSSTRPRVSCVVCARPSATGSAPRAAVAHKAVNSFRMGASSYVVREKRPGGPAVRRGAG